MVKWITKDGKHIPISDSKSANRPTVDYAQKYGEKQKIYDKYKNMNTGTIIQHLSPVEIEKVKNFTNKHGFYDVKSEVQLGVVIKHIANDTPTELTVWSNELGDKIINISIADIAWQNRVVQWYFGGHKYAGVDIATRVQKRLEDEGI